MLISSILVLYKKTWIKYLLLQVPGERHDDLYKLICAMLKAITKDDFNEVHQRLQINYANHTIYVLQYMKNG